MSAATIPFTASPTTPAAAARPWTPSDRDRLVFQWVKFDGHQQSWVATQLGINQSTVSRMVERYERWIARGGPSQQGAPSHDERLRTQRWLAYERNEWILTSALRIAGEMERALDTTQSTVLHPRHDPSQQSKVRTEYKVIDRSGLAARFLRLAYRINMDQLKLVEQDPLPPLESLTIDDLNEDHLPALADLPLDQAPGFACPDCHHPTSDSSSPELKTEHRKLTTLPTDCPEPSPADRATEDCPPVAPSNAPSGPGEALEPTAPPLAPPSDSLLDDRVITSIQLSPDAPPLHQTHKLGHPKSTLSSSRPTSSDEITPSQKSPPPAYAEPSSPPEPTSPRELITIAAAPENAAAEEEIESAESAGFG